MNQYKIQLPQEAAQFYEKIARKAGRPMEQVLADSLYVLAGELAQEAIRRKKSKEKPM